MRHKAKTSPSGVAQFQDRLLELLWQGKSPRQVRRALLSDPALADFHAYIRRMDDSMIEVARELASKWGVKA
jgi:hypothetical protein